MTFTMLKRRILLPLSVACLLTMACQQGEAPPRQETVYRFAPTAAWADEFDVAGLPDSTKWGYDVGGSGWGNNELQYYTHARAENARVEGGQLVIEARREPLGGREYTSARLVSRGRKHFTYGAFEIRARLPQGRGTWPALWMLASESTYGTTYWPDNGEIDIMEHVGFNPGTVFATVHTQAYNHIRRTQVGDSIQVPTFASTFHTYRLEWTPDYIHVSVDGERFFTFRRSGGWQQWPFDRPFFLLMNIAVGGNWGGQRGVDASIFPQRMEVDYVRYYPLER
jgi:beta-glucanase (GH16 family)